jgi:hypothetical protein
MDTATDNGAEKVEEILEEVIVENVETITETSGEIKVEIVVVEPTDYTQNDLGRLKRTLSEKCSCCNHALQLRTRKMDSLLRGETIQEEEDYKYCPNCYEEIEIRDQKKRKATDGFDKTRLKPEDMVVKDDRKGTRRDNNNDRYPKRSPNAEGTRKDNRKSFRGR